MKDKTLVLILIVILVPLAIVLSVKNYKECKDAGFTTRYCVLTHILK